MKKFGVCSVLAICLMVMGSAAIQTRVTAPVVAVASKAVQEKKEIGSMKDCMVASALFNKYNTTYRMECDLVITDLD